MESPRSRMGRFSLLLLDDGEVLVSDVACQHCLTVTEGARVSSTLGRLAGVTRTGRLKVATRNIFFDSDDWRDPVVKIPITAITSVGPSRDSSNRRSGRRPRTSSSPATSAELSSLPSWRRSFSPRMVKGRNVVASPLKPHMIAVQSNVVIFQRENGADHPYIEEQVTAMHEFTPTYAECDVLRSELQSLKNINSSPSRKARDSALRDLVQERENRVPFDITLLQFGLAEDARGDYPASAIYALSRAPGRVRITSKNLYFMPIHGDSNHSVERIPLDSLVSIRRLRHGCTDSALEVAFSVAYEPNKPAKSLMLTFQSFETREEAFSTLCNSSEKKLDIYGTDELEVALTKWRRGEMSNYDYLMYLNFAAGRSFNDLSQYPVFPWILSDYTSVELDLEDASVYRDLSKPIGALDEARLATLKQRYLEMPPPRFFYGTHYSTPAYVINYLVRAAPGAMLRLQNGRFDMPDRLFHSIEETWKGVCTNQADVKELLPEFYAVDYRSTVSSGILSSNAAPGQFLDNVLGLELGTRQDGKRVDAVELPPWAKGSTKKFVSIMKEALEGRFVSENLHNWIDLIFGAKSRSESACNIFYTDVALPISLDTKRKLSLRNEDIDQYETMYLEFGRTPEQLFFTAHPSRLNPDDSAPQLAPQPPVAPIVSSISGSGHRSSRTEKEPEEEKDENENTPTNTPKKETPKWGSFENLKGLRSPTVSRSNSFLDKIQHIVRSPRSPRKGKRDTDDASGTLRGASVRTYPLDGANSDAQLIDAALVALPSARENDSSKAEGAMFALCTVWNDGYLRVQLKSEILRSRLIDGVSALEAVGTGLLCYGTSGGALGSYQLSSGRSHTMMTAAHDTRVTSLAYVPLLQLLVSGSVDGCVKVWQLFRARDGSCALLCALELDAEGPVRELTASHEDDGSSAIRARSETLEWAVRRVLVAASTSDGTLLVWAPDRYTAGDTHIEPIWRRRIGSVDNEPERRMCWLAQRRGARRSVAVASSCGRFVRAHTPGREGAVVIECRGVAGVAAAQDSPTVVVATTQGVVAEYDTTGLRVGRRDTLLADTRRFVMQRDGLGVVAIANDKMWVHVTF